ncbi:TPA: TIGR03758 family integrating conjugative element protein [Salmonella enterica]|uniref:TIGR03758 family integrating conjugative element protein n=1 Tax=Salmonella enterica TaxID=28901 RepID=A0A7U5YN60_SALER|nr:TIGR03758 family integrating conjugative element protein [Salmonella enterica]ECC1575459.1 TIGR03758 family integrating conjugative element protein [Salmonella enterica subsp. diarizonae]AXD70310.1 TIGR03758 family integrating conjugative element protein [Salmonella enterica]EAP0956757.1 TIGR03758 family integrating conjugative element protein [Salmonella enterica]EBA7039691.1 TIGR03758 family integrating conjugative element protein [Salmonella enterica]ECE0109899.1 TIGR03758 family integra
MNGVQRAAFIAGSGGLEPANIKHLVTALFFALLFLLAAWMIRTVYVGWSNQNVKAGDAGMFVVRLIILLELAMLFYSY